MDINNIKVIHEFFVDTQKTVEEVQETVENGQPVKTIRSVVKTVPVKMGLRQLTRRESIAATMFHGVEYNRFVSAGYLTKSMMINKYANVTGGVLSDQERARLVELAKKDAELQEDYLRAKDESDDVKTNILKARAKIQMEFMEINSANEAAFAFTAEAQAESRLNLWFIFNMIVIDQNGKWKPYFEGDTFEKQEDFMFVLEEKNDEFFQKASAKIVNYVAFYIQGARKTEEFNDYDARLKAQLEARAPKAAPTSEAVQSEDFKESEKGGRIDAPSAPVAETVVTI